MNRVLLNIINNAFYAVNQRNKIVLENLTSIEKLENKKEYQPKVIISTRKVENTIEISILDNGLGIPAQNLDKIFQPFFTTKPTGQGTGLGLSLSYDIIKAHGGELKVETKEGEGTEFIIILSIYSHL